MGLSSLLFFVIAIGCLVQSEAGTPCPKRGELYPCMCTEVPQSKNQIFTIVTCRHVPNKRSLASIFGTLRTMRIDRFIIYDSYWEAGNFDDKQKELERQLPQNFLTLLMIRELEIHDSIISSCFACDITAGCPNTFVHGLSIYNSSSTDNVCTTCNGKRSWTNCINSLKHFDFVGNKLKALEKDFFAMPMNQLTRVNFSANEIQKIGINAFTNLPKLTTLDLSRNKISELSDNMFGGKDTPIQYIDLSQNYLKTLPSSLFKNTPYLLTFSAATNYLQKLPHDEWKYLSKRIRTVDLTGNPLHCDCHLIWLNCTTKAHVQFIGYCANEGFDLTPLRRVSRYVSERCVNGNLQEQRRNKTEPNGCHEFLLKQKEGLHMLEVNRVAPNRRDRKPGTLKPRTL